MRFMIIVRATPETEAEGNPLPEDETVLPAMLAYHDELARAGVLLEGNGLKPSRHGWRIRYPGDGRR
ncbi:MAG: YciI family protein, partial [Aquincola sp.]|nr:YciI family protein [Aquincola sp.]